MITNKEIDLIVNSLSVDELIGQMLCFNFVPNYTEQDIRNIVTKTKAGSFFVANINQKKIKLCTDIMNELTKVPGMIAADIENGPGHILEGEVILPSPMAWGACDDEELIYKAHIATAERCRELGIHWSFSPIVDINYNPDNPVTNIRAISDVPQKVAKIASAAIKGLQENGLIAAGCKHFPGDGMDSRNQHFCTTINNLSKEDWMDTYGYVYKEIIKENPASIMVAHIALPAYDEMINEYIGYPPASLSYNLQTKLLREQLGYNGCIVSDAFSMVGVAAAAEFDRLPIEFIKAGGDIVLFALPEYFDFIKKAVENNEISIDRLKQSVTRILELKNRARLFDNQRDVLNDITNKFDLNELSDKIAEKSITLIRNGSECLPVNLNRGDKVLILNIQKYNHDDTAFFVSNLKTFENELKIRGMEVFSFNNASRADFENIIDECAAVFINCKISSHEGFGGSLRITSQHIGPFWRGKVLRHPQIVFTSFGDPYKIFDFPYIKTYINAYSYSPSSQKAAVKAILGEIEFQGKTPVSLSNFF